MSWFDTRPGEQLFYTDEGEGPAVMCLHGWSCDGADWSFLDTELGSEHRLVVPDHRGHGRSSVAAGGYSPALFADDAAALLDHLGITDALVVGHSMGTIIASALAVRRPELVRALVLVDPVYGIAAAEVAPVLAALRQAPHAVAWKAFERFYVEQTPAWLPVWHRRRLLGTPADVVRDSLVGLYEGPDGIGEAALGAPFLRRREVPVLALYAEGRDAQADWERGLDQGPYDVSEVWVGTGHFLHQEQPERFAARVRAWVETLPAPSESRWSPDQGQ